MIQLEYIPLNKYDEVIEHFDGTVTIPIHKKKRYLYASNLVEDKIYLLNNLTGCLFSYNFVTKEIYQINKTNRSIWQKCKGIAVINKQILTYNTQLQAFVFFNLETQLFEKEIIFTKNVESFYIKDSVLLIHLKDEATLLKCYLTNSTITKISSFKVKGIGNSSLLVNENSIYITDSEENLIRKYSFDGDLLFEAITPFIDPIGQFFYKEDYYIIYGGLVNEVGYENRCWQEQKPFIHKLKIEVVEDKKYITTYTNTFEVEFFYEEKFYEDSLKNLTPMTIYLALPIDSENQKIISITPNGLPFTIEYKNNLPFAKFTINKEDTDIQSIGYKAILQLRSFKKVVKNETTLKLSTKDLLSQEEKEYLGCDDPFFRKFIINENISDIKKALILRNEIFKRLEYKKNIHARNFKEVLEDGYGTCGDYTNLLLILYNINNISTNSATGYKIPRFYNATSGIISVYYNHSWIEIYDSNEKALPLESSSDDKEYKQRFSEGQFLGLDWTHIKLYNGKAFPNLIYIPTHPQLHPFDIFKKASVFVIVKREV